MNSQKLLRQTLQSLLDSDPTKNELKAGIALVIQTIGYGKRTDSLTLKRLAKITGINIKGGIDRIEKPLSQLIEKGVFDRTEHKGRNFDYTYSVPDRFFEGEVVERFFAPSVPVTEVAPQSAMTDSQPLLTYRDTPSTEINQHKTDSAEPEVSEPLRTDQPIVCDVNNASVEKPSAVNDEAYRRLLPALKKLPVPQANQVLQLVALAVTDGTIRTTQERMGGGLIKAARAGTLDTSRLEQARVSELKRKQAEKAEAERARQIQVQENNHLAWLAKAGGVDISFLNGGVV